MAQIRDLLVSKLGARLLLGGITGGEALSTGDWVIGSSHGNASKQG